MLHKFILIKYTWIFISQKELQTTEGPNPLPKCANGSLLKTKFYWKKMKNFLIMESAKINSLLMHH